MDKEGALAEIQRLSFAEKIEKLSEADTAYLEDYIDKTRAAVKNNDASSAGQMTNKK